ncbi:retron Ec78 anti-phage system effector HNH endonuclease PtuB [Pseudomonas fontis]|uniref:TIGR02646 family protein n=1 Tax=Pseudomonas fontis TaxID=2942633 RepID=A0ABT5P156_9PSED|nr:retron Ec78 anti-phage system effector HNH endonuclease PtuB [Pseudomonas fontis]MDD0977492.1 TIGR02646 family protein [Pseudomonas fontis]MDD0994082.1 TIGR02646 family protein [Pseudomonas fontis]
MRKLERQEAPGCLAHYQHGQQLWADVTPEHKAEIWAHLTMMQDVRCAYCESLIEPTARHIEHFVQKGRDARVTFRWSNLFGSCNVKGSCGGHKDSCGRYDPNVLIKPDTDDASDYWVFVSDGTIRVRANLTPLDQQRAEESLRIFNLHATGGKLRSMRRTSLMRYLETAEELAGLAAECTTDEWQELLAGELEAIASEPFSTAIRHLLEGTGRY